MTQSSETVTQSTDTSAALGRPQFAHPRLQELETFLDERHAELRAAVDAVPPAFRNRRPAPDRWSTAEVLEHLAMLERRVTGLLVGAIAEARTSGTTESDTSSVRPRLDTEGMRDRSRAIKAPDITQPRGELDAEAAWAALERTRVAFLVTLAAGDGLALGTVTRPHPILGPLDLYQWVLAVGGHEARHVAQIREIAQRFGAQTSSAAVS